MQPGWHMEPKRNALFSSTRDSWCTPVEILDKIRRIAPIGLDPCSNSESIVEAKTSWTKEDNAFSKATWAGYGLVYCNPPYGREIGKWVARCVREHMVHGAEVIMLLPARTDVRWFQTYGRAASVICFLRGRVRFVGAKHAAPFPSMLLYFGHERIDEFMDVFENDGWMLTNPRP